MIELNISIKTLDRARKRAATMPTSLHNSITKGAGTLTGCIGEELIREVIGVSKLKDEFNYDFDFTIKSTGETIDVKSKATSVQPLPNYDCSVSGHNIKQHCTHYAFCRVTKDLTKGWVLGYLPKEEFFSLAKFYKIGDRDPSHRSFTYKSDTYSVSIDQLKNIELLAA
jgi:hypothetical protein|tara:strand:+ start:830 stop:1336 length:507 start_codon:yes stop_codon:yes gene_type:complete